MEKSHVPGYVDNSLQYLTAFGAYAELQKCTNKGRECVFPTQSRRGGPRIHRNKQPLSRRDLSSDHDINKGLMATSTCENCRPGMPGLCGEHCIDFNPVFDRAIPPMINPGSGLKVLDDPFTDTDDLFNSIFSSATAPGPLIQASSPRPTQARDRPLGVRRYSSAADL